jgi:hypothetical protein
LGDRFAVFHDYWLARGQSRGNLWHSHRYFGDPRGDLKNVVRALNDLDKRITLLEERTR